MKTRYARRLFSADNLLAKLTKHEEKAKMSRAEQSRAEVKLGCDQQVQICGSK